jgi:hypothetical protein
MTKQRVMPQPGGTYIMQTGEPKTIVFDFVSIGHFRVNGVDKFVQSYSDQALPWTVSDAR